MAMSVGGGGGRAVGCFDEVMNSAILFSSNSFVLGDQSVRLGLCIPAMYIIYPQYHLKNCGMITLWGLGVTLYVFSLTIADVMREAWVILNVHQISTKPVNFLTLT